VVAVRWYLRYGLSYRDVEELVAERGVQVDHVTVFGFVRRFMPLLADAARFHRHAPADRWYVDEAYVKVNGIWRYVYRAVDQHGQVIDVLVSARHDAKAAGRFFSRALATLKVRPSEVVTDAAPVYRGGGRGADPFGVAPRRAVRQQSDRSRSQSTQARLRPMRGLRTDRTARVIIAGHASMQNLRRGQCELGLDIPPALRVAAAFIELAHAI